MCCIYVYRYVYLVLNYQCKLHLVCIKKDKFRFLNPIKSILVKKKCKLVILFNCIEHEISKIDSSSLKKLFPKEEMLLTS